MKRTKSSSLPAKEILVEVPLDSQISSPQIEQHYQDCSSFAEDNDDEVDDTGSIDEHESDHDEPDEDDPSDADESAGSSHNNDSDVELNDRGHKKFIFDDDVEEEPVQSSSIHSEYRIEMFDDGDEVGSHVDSTKSTSGTSQGQESNDSTSATSHLWDVVNWEPKMLPNDQLPKKVKDGEGEQSSTISYPNCHFTKSEIEHTIRSGLKNDKGNFDYFMICKRKAEFEWVRRNYTRDSNKMILTRRVYHAQQELLAMYRWVDIKTYSHSDHKTPHQYERKFKVRDQVWKRVYATRGQPYDDAYDLKTDYRFDVMRGRLHELQLRPLAVRMRKTEYRDPNYNLMKGIYAPWTSRDKRISEAQKNMLPMVNFDNLDQFPNAQTQLNDFNDEYKRQERANAPTQVEPVVFSKIPKKRKPESRDPSPSAARVRTQQPAPAVPPAVPGIPRGAPHSTVSYAGAVMGASTPSTGTVLGSVAVPTYGYTHQVTATTSSDIVTVEKINVKNIRLLLSELRARLQHNLPAVSLSLIMTPDAMDVAAKTLYHQCYQGRSYWPIDSTSNRKYDIKAGWTLVLQWEPITFCERMIEVIPSEHSTNESTNKVNTLNKELLGIRFKGNFSANNMQKLIEILSAFELKHKPDEFDANYTIFSLQRMCKAFILVSAKAVGSDEKAKPLEWAALNEIVNGYTVDKGWETRVQTFSQFSIEYIEKINVRVAVCDAARTMRISHIPGLVADPDHHQNPDRHGKGNEGDGSGRNPKRQRERDEKKSSHYGPGGGSGGGD